MLTFRPSDLPWERFWCPRGGTVTLDWSGFSVDPRDGLSAYFQTDLLRSAALDIVPCVIHLGESGMGKSHELGRLYGAAGDDEHPVIFEDLRQYDSTQALRDDIFGSDVFRTWAEGEGKLTLVLDSLDEALLLIRVLPTWLIKQLRRYPPDRLRLRIACRTAHWPQVMEDGLRGIWGETNVGVYELAPLTAADVRSAAVARGLDPGAFLTEVTRRDAAPLASKPTTLHFLLNAFARHEAFPPTQAELYRLGCLHLCDEDEERRVSGRAGSLDREQRLAVAGRVAAATIFGNRAAVWRGRDLTERPSAEVSLPELAGGSEPAGGERRVLVADCELEETLGTGLFSARGSMSLGWAHQTYAEFLAARWVVGHALSMPQIESLIRHPHDPDHRLAPQLRETIAWLAGMHPGVRQLVLATEPELLLEADPESVSHEERSAIVDALLHATSRGELPYPEWARRRRYESLAHPGLAEQLRPYLSDQTQPEPVRELAIEIASSAGASALQAICAAIALDSNEPLGIRTEAARAVAAIGDLETRALLLPLAVDPQEEDVDDDLKGLALRAVWPDHLAPERLFSALSCPKRANRSGAYDVFLSQLAEHLTSELLPAGLRWAVDASGGFGMRGRLADAIVRAAWKHLDIPEVLMAFADLAALRFRRYEDLVDRDDGEDLTTLDAAYVGRRRKVVEELLARMGTEVEQITVPFTHRLRPLIGHDDLDWVLERTAGCEADDEHGEAWARLLEAIIDLREPSDFEKLYRYRDRPHIAAAFARWWEPVPLDSPEVDRVRRQHREWEEKRERRRLREPPPPELPSAARVLAIFERNEAFGDENSPDAIGEVWCSAAQELTRSRDGRSYNLGENLDRGPTWEQLASREKERLLDAAERYVRIRAGSVAEWTAGGQRTMGTWAGDRALRLLAAHTPERLTTLPVDVWAAWTPVVLRNRPPSSDKKASAQHQTLLACAYAQAPDQFISAACEVLLEEDAKQGGFWSLGSLEPLWDERFGAAMLALVQTSGLTTSSFQALLEALLKRGVPGTRSYAESLLLAPLPRAAARRGRVVAAATALLVEEPDGGWPILRPILRRSRMFRRELFLAAAYRAWRLDRFGEDQLADMFAWLTEEFPYPDPWHVGVYSPSPEDEARQWRSNVMSALRNRVTPAAVAALERLKSRFPELTWLSHWILKTREALRRETWVAPEVPQILALAERADRRLVVSGDQLLDLLIESLARFEGELQGELPAVSGLWDHLGDGWYRPKDEQELSDAIARHLRRDLHGRGVVAGREVVIRRGGVGGVPGQRTDLYVTVAPAPSHGSAEPISAIIEVKGSWHGDVLTAMENQLAGEYLARNPECRHGLYVVGWYLCGRWQEESRKRKTRRHRSSEVLRDALTEQARSLSTGGRTLRAFVLDAAWR